MPIITFLQRTWMLLAFVILADLACLNDDLFKHLGMLLYVPAMAATVVFIALLLVHLFFRQTVDQDAHDGTYLTDWRGLTAHQRVAWATVIRIGFVIALCILCAGLARGEAPDQRARWDAAQINPASSLALDGKVALYRRLAPRYEKITAMRRNGVPAPVIFGLHQRESSGDFTCHPHEGSPLTHRTRFVPKGRLPPPDDPPYTFDQSARDAYYVCDRLDAKDWCYLATRLQAIESFNGIGYQKFHPDVPSPYLWSGTSIYRRGKYTGDGRFDRLAVDKQLGVAAILKRLQQRGTYVFCNSSP